MNCVQVSVSGEVISVVWEDRLRREEAAYYYIEGERDSERVCP